MRFSNRFANIFQKVLPSPFTIAVVLTLFVLVMALLPSGKPEARIQVVHEMTTAEELVVVGSGGDYCEWGDGTIGDTLRVSPEVGEIIELTTHQDGGSYVNSASLTVEEGEAGKQTYRILENTEDKSTFEQLILFWESEMWSAPLLGFLVQMMLMLVLGHALALSKPVSKLIDSATRLCTTPAFAAALVTAFTIAVSLFNWGLGLIFGAIFARKVGERFASEGRSLNYGLIGAAGYSGLMVWHGGISGSAPIKVSETNAITSLMEGSQLTAEQLQSLPTEIGFQDTVFSTMNLVTSATLLLILPLFMYWLAGRQSHGLLPQGLFSLAKKSEPKEVTGAERLDYSPYLSYALGALLLGFVGYKTILAQDNGFSLKFINPNYINLLLLGLCFVMHRSIVQFLRAADEAVKGASGILLQFPLYFGILGLMKHSGLMSDISHWFISISDQNTYPVLTFFSAGLVNIFVPSGGGQWAVQGPIVVESATTMGVPLGKSIMALSYGDQLTNMMQPFWALPLLSITGLKARQILPYTLMLMLVGMLIFLTMLVVF